MSRRRTYLEGPFSLNARVIKHEVTSTSAGTFVLGKANGRSIKIMFVGRSDENVATKLLEHVGKYPIFKYGYSKTPHDAWAKECKLFHDFNPPHSQHPLKPTSSPDWPCPICGKGDTEHVQSTVQGEQR